MPPDDRFPSATIGNGIVQADLYLPDPRSGYYRGSRFDWSGAFGSLTCGGHSYVGQWFPVHDPRIHDAISGPVEAFIPIGFDEASPGETFLAIGIGTLRRPDDSPYRFSYPYEIVNGGRWHTVPAEDRIDFTHEMDDGAGRAYRYAKTVRLMPGAPRMRLEHRLRNTGTLPLETTAFNHNFFMLDGRPTGPALTVSFEFDAVPVGPGHGFGKLADVRGDGIVYRGQLEPGEIVASALEGFGDTPSDHDIRIENAESGAGLRITGDRPIRRLYFWSIRNTACPEPYIDVRVDPGAEFTWTTSYEFYDLKGDGNAGSDRNYQPVSPVGTIC